MKNRLTLSALLLSVSLLSFADPRLILQAPWVSNSYSTNIFMHDITVDVFFQGPHVKVTNQMTITARHENLAYGKYVFQLKNEAVLTDCEVLVDGEFIKAEMYERDELVNPVDSGLIVPLRVEKSSISYWFHVFPLSESRTIRFSYLLPSNMFDGKMSATIPMEYLKVRYGNDVRVRIHQLGSFTPISTSSVNTMNIQENNGQTYGELQVDKENLDDDLTINYSKGSSSGYLLQTYPVGNDYGYYMFIADSLEFIDTVISRHVAVIFDHEDANTETTGLEVWDKTKNTLKSRLSDDDFFNLFYTNFTTKKASDVWINATDSNIDSVFQELWTQAPLSGHSNLSEAIGTVDQFITDYPANKNVQTVLVSSKVHYSSSSSIDQFVSDFKSLNTNYPIYIADYITSDQNHIRNYPNNDYLYQQLAEITGGHFSREINDLNSGLKKVFDKSDNSYNDVECTLSVGGSGYTEEDYILHQKNRWHAGEYFIQIGKYHGQGEFSAQFKAHIGDYEFLGTDVVDIDFVSSQDALHKMWALEKLKTLDPSSSEHLDFTIQESLLTTENMFYALDPLVDYADYICHKCSYIPNILSIKEFEEALSEQIYPNPVVSELHVNLPNQFSQTENDLSVFLTTLRGNIIDDQFTWKLTSGHLTIDSLEDLQSGVYFLVIASSGYSASFRVVKE